MTPAQTERLMQVHQRAAQAGHGRKTEIYRAAADELGMSLASLQRALGKLTVRSTRKRRADAGSTALSREEALVISSLLLESTRKNGKRLYSIADAVNALRADRMIKAQYVDEETGEVRPLSESTISRALYGYGLHPSQLMAPAPAVELASEHPNHVWQIDASLCVLYYLRPEADVRRNGLRVMDHDEFYKNKPKNLARIAADRVWSYEITDHASGWVYVEYVMGAESGENLCSVLINAMQDRGGADLLHGVPRILYMDAGSANTAAMTKALCKALGIEILVHRVGNARATGQVENARNLIERKFEPGLKFQPVNSLDELNGLARKWRAHFNATAVHSRHNMTRTDAWLRILATQLIKCPPVEVCRELAVSAPQLRKVTPQLRVSYGGREFDVSTVPGILVGAKIPVTRNPWRDDAAQVVLVGADGREVIHVVSEVTRGEFGFAHTARTIGQEFRGIAETPAQSAAKEIEQLVTGTTTVGDAETARKAKAVPYGGRFNPYQEIDAAQLPAFMPRRGTDHHLVAPVVQVPPLTLFELAKRLKTLLGDMWTADSYAWLEQHHPKGAPEDDISAIAQSLRASRRPELRIVRSA
ncbi:integrase catalytic domain-containing protein [Chitiniphilus shinanonensis]|uniref:integrase catalytic domain-containing protein n=1 Tax=Chitiniphilus shinanonensis TaxID=553088 RepID=UPI00303532F8